MAVMLPMETLSSVKVSFKVGLPDGAFTFSMVPLGLDAGEIAEAELGIRLHLDAVCDANEITLTLFTSRHSTSTGYEELQAHQKLLEPFSAASPAEPWIAQSLSDSYRPHTSPDHSSATHAEPEHPEFMSNAQSKPSDMGLHHHGDLSLSFEASGNQYQAQDVSHNFYHEYLFDSASLGFCSRHIDGSQYPRGEFSASSQASQSFASSSPDPESPGASTSTSPSTSPISSFSSPTPTAPRPHGARSRTQQCPEPSCDRQFTSKYTLSKHVTTHEPRPVKFFPCAMGCTMHFSRKHDRLRHEVTQHGRVCEWGCNACLGFFSSEPATLKKHRCRISGALGLQGHASDVQH
ncbi:hypothetical protein B0H15DRAFT_931356 [Mycena belliarum]|uniref:C2H2-type domain-containing protein n=1 Tax=Mycena belliarum TaxID=1033014 RepID=A0AAD6XTR5_9AGAR|nr:hypothetical protein B0H15DRAFT_931356 [Mycena belliae]